VTWQQAVPTAHYASDLRLSERAGDPAGLLRARRPSDSAGRTARDGMYCSGNFRSGSIERSSNCRDVWLRLTHGVTRALANPRPEAKFASS
jgi:hypothetical protein